MYHDNSVNPYPSGCIKGTLTYPAPIECEKQSSVKEVRERREPEAATILGKGV